MERRAPVLAWYLLPLGILGASMGVLRAARGRLPEQVPVHFGGGLRPDAWVARGSPALLAPALVGLGLLVGLFALDLLLTRRTRATGAEARVRRALLAAALFLSVLFGAGLLVGFLGPRVLLAVVGVGATGLLGSLLWAAAVRRG